MNGFLHSQNCKNKYTYDYAQLCSRYSLVSNPQPMIDNCSSSFYNNSHFSRCVSIVEKAIGAEGVVPTRRCKLYLQFIVRICIMQTLHNKGASPCNSFSGQTLSDIYLLLIFARFLYLSIKIYSKLSV